MRSPEHSRIATRVQPDIPDERVAWALIPGQFFQDRTLTRTDIYVLGAVAAMSTSGRANMPDWRDLQAFLGYARQRIQQSLSRLCAKDFLRHFRDAGTTRYYVRLDATPAEIEATIERAS